MQLISSIHIERYRSCRKVDIEQFGSYNVLAGQNNAGKSNVLRALSLFFTGQPEPGRQLDLSAECNARSNEKKRIGIAVAFDLPATITIHKNLKSVEDLIPRPCEIKKEFTIDSSTPSGYLVTYYLDGQEVPIEQKVVVDQFLNLFNFRYVTAERTPRAVLTDNLEELKSELSTRINRGKRKSDSISSDTSLRSTALQKIREVADNLFEPIRSQVSEADSNIAHVRMATPDSVMELLNTAKYEITNVQGEVQNETAMGSGLQSLLLFSVLFLVDKNYHRKFGWKIATIWAVEEPEVFLHFDLEIQLAHYLHDIAEDADNRFQLFCSTHSAAVSQFGDAHYMVKKQIDQNRYATTSVEPIPKTKFVYSLYEARVAALQHPLTLYPSQPIVLVEGDIDEYALRYALGRASYAHSDNVFSISTLLDNKKQHGDAFLVDYVAKNITIANSRPHNAPLIVILDWDVELSKYNKLRKILESPNKVIQFDKGNANPELDDSFRGIERFYDTEVIANFMANHNGYIFDRGEYPSGPPRYHPDIQRLAMIKKNLLRILLDGDFECRHLHAVVSEIVKATTT